MRKSYNQFLHALKKDVLSFRGFTVLAFVLFVAMYYILAGNWWIINLFSAIPPISFLIFWLILFLVVTRKVRKHLFSLILLFILLPSVITFSDLNFNAITFNVDEQKVEQSDLKILNWNTQFWEPEENWGELFETIKGFDADIVQIQEHILLGSYGFIDLDDREILNKTFPEYEIVIVGEFVTMSKYPILNYEHGPQGGYLKTVIEKEEKEISLYNVHIPIHFNYGLFPSVGFVSNIKYRFNLRETVIENLVQAVKNDENPMIISGDFNTTSTMRNLDELFEISIDAQKYSNEIFPATWDAYGVELWRIDYVLTKGAIQPIKYDSVDLSQFSDHDAQVVYFDLI